jgi:hypothetical protein
MITAEKKWGIKLMVWTVFLNLVWRQWLIKTANRMGNGNPAIRP